MTGWIAVAILLGIIFCADVRADSEDHGFLGVYPGVKVKIITKKGEEPITGVSIKVVDDGPADKAGLQDDDVIIEFNGNEVEDAGDLRRLIRDTEPGDEVEVAVYRDGDRKTFTVKMGESEEEEETFSWMGNEGWRTPYRGFVKKFVLRDWDRPWLGVELQKLSDQLREFFKVEEGGVLISEVKEDSPAEKAGLKAGDVIIEMDGEEVDSRRDVIEILEDKEIGDEVSITIVRDGKDKRKKAVLGENPHKDKMFSCIIEKEFDPEDLEALKRLDELEIMEGFDLDELLESLKDIRLEVGGEVEDLKEEIEKLKEEVDRLKQGQK